MLGMRMASGGHNRHGAYMATWVFGEHLEPGMNNVGSGMNNVGGDLTIPEDHPEGLVRLPALGRVSVPAGRRAGVHFLVDRVG